MSRYSRAYHAMVTIETRNNMCSSLKGRRGLRAPAFVECTIRDAWYACHIVLSAKAEARLLHVRSRLQHLATRSQYACNMLASMFQGVASLLHGVARMLQGVASMFHGSARVLQACCKRYCKDLGVSLIGRARSTLADMPMAMPITRPLLSSDWSVPICGGAAPTPPLIGCMRTLSGAVPAQVS